MHTDGADGCIDLKIFVGVKLIIEKGQKQVRSLTNSLQDNLITKQKVTTLVRHSKKQCHTFLSFIRLSPWLWCKRGTLMFLWGFSMAHFHGKSSMLWPCQHRQAHIAHCGESGSKARTRTALPSNRAEWSISRRRMRGLTLDLSKMCQRVAS